MNKFRKSLVRRFDVVTFDIFDTLIERCVTTPQEIFRLAGRKILGNEKADAFFLDRQAAEKKAREKRADGEVTLEEIYAELYTIYENMTDSLMWSEINTELASCRPKIQNKEWMEWCLKQRKKVYLVSDMYLPSGLIREMLYRCGIQGYHKLYVSGEYRSNKTTGELFRKMLEENCLLPKQVLHIGDSFHADILGAHKVGIHSVFLMKCYIKN